MQYYILLILSVVITLTAQIYVNSSYKKYKKVKLNSDLTGVEIAQKILSANNLEDVYVTEVRGELTDHYDPKRKVIRLSSSIFHENTVAAASVAAHEVGHALQDKDNYIFIRIRGFLIPIVNFSSKLGYFAILIGFLFGYLDFVWAGIILLAVILVFQLITLPVEFDASRRAKEELKRLKLISKEELDGSNKMLKSAAYTYVASLATTVLEILRLFLMAKNSD